MISAKTYNLKGEALKDTALPEAVFGVKAKPSLLAQAVRVYLANQRRGMAHTKTRSMVAKTTAKMFKQKGTGRARHGSYAAPIFVGGGIAHGPSGEQNYRLRMPAQMKRLALLGALSAKAAKGEVAVISGAEEATGKTRETAGLRTALGKSKALIITSSQLTNFTRAIRNLDRTNVVSSQNLNTYTILAYPQLVLAKQALDEIKKVYAA